ncbi:pseudouridine-5'-phosphate glycosidase family protein [Rhodotorula paludigena]|uniref:pseudouridine-5'-phosphate glycosidase family protein n=1 Tax=Rhodotorula paludigena TaxID=86838 RepID=UPI00318106BF
MLSRVARQNFVRRPRTRSFTASSVARWQHPLPSLSGLPVDIAPEVAQAQAEGRPVVALESTLITHGLPPPHSQTLAKECETLLRSQGVAPATIAILDGRVKVGLEERDLDLLAELGWEARRDADVAKRLWKVGRRELGAALVKGVHGGTTVSGTMAVAHLAGIKIFSTGGIGGVHRGAETSFDISSDLISLSDTPVAVVCAGSKSILDIGLTLEYLEAHAVPVAGYKTSDWPAFYTAKSGFKAPMQLDSAAEVAHTILTTDRLGLSSSLLLGNPIPAEYHAVGAGLQTAVDQAVAESVENGMAKSGKQVTPWLLQRVAELSKGKSLESNKALIRNNVKVGGEVAVEYARLLKESSAAPASTSMPSFPPSPASSPAPIPADPSAPTETGFLAHPVAPAPLVVVGVLAVDISMVPNSTSPLQTTAPGSVSLTLGGVAGNVAGAAHALLSAPSSNQDGGEVLLVAPVAGDLLGEVAKSGLRARGMRSDGLIGSDGATATCGYLLDEKGELVGGVADMSIAKELSGKKIAERIAEVKPKLVCFDGNIEMNAMVEVLLHCDKHGTSTFFEPTSNAKSLQLLNALESSPLSSLLPLAAAPVSYSAPNVHELSALYDRVAFSEHSIYAPGPWFDSISVRADELALRLPRWVVDEGIAQMAVRLLPVIGTLFVKNGAQGVLVVQRVSGIDAVSRWRNLPPKKGTLVVPSASTPAEAVVLRHYPALELDASEIISVTGAGDNLAGATLAAMVRGLSPLVPYELDQIVEVAQKAAVATLKSAEAVGNHTTLQQALIAL